MKNKTALKRKPPNNKSSRNPKNLLMSGACLTSGGGSQSLESYSWFTQSPWNRSSVGPLEHPVLLAKVDLVKRRGLSINGVLTGPFSHALIQAVVWC